MIIKEQEKWLLNCLSKNEQSEYGLKYCFNTTNSIQSYQNNVPLTTYEDIEPYIAKIYKGLKDILFLGEPVAFELTGGSTGGEKLIPYTKESFADFQRAILPWFISAIQNYGLSGKDIYLAISPALRRKEKSEGGIRIGVNDEEYLGGILSNLSESSLIPSWVGDLEDISTWQLCTLYWLIRSKELELISVWSPTFLLMLLDTLDERENDLIILLENGDEIDGHTLKADKEALLRLTEYIAKKNTALLWPNIKLISCWGDASSKPFFEALKKRFSHVNFQAKGLISTESVVTVPDENGNPTLAINSAFYEFLQADGKILLADELCANESYEVIITTNGGLYRYRSGDIVLCDSCNKEKVILTFQGRSGIFSDLVGEKLTESFVSHSLKDIDAPAILSPSSSVGYQLLIEKDLSQDTAIICDQVEKNLYKNPQYKYARKIGQLEKLKIFQVQGLSKFYLEYMAKKGSRMGDIKIPSLCTDKEFCHIIKEETI
jgi:phenylacetate-coenzyme A ligase PaaK-like adenylate-forming protein